MQQKTDLISRLSFVIPNLIRNPEFSAHTPDSRFSPRFVVEAGRGNDT